MSRAVVTYDDFRGGEWGTLGARRARQGMFQGTNVRVYGDGQIGPRPGVRDLGITSLTAGDAYGVAYRPFGSQELVFVIGDKVRVAPWNVGGVSSLAGTLGGTPTKIVRFNEATRRLNAKTYFAVYGQGVYSIDATPTLAGPIAGAPDGYDVTLYRDRLIASDGNEQVFYSDAADFATWDALSYISVGYEYPMFALVSHRDGLSLFGQALIWRLTGTLGVSDVLRRASSALALSPNGDVVLDGETCIYIPNARNAPVLWDGGIADERSLAHLETWDDQNASVNFGGAIARRFNDVLFVSDSANNPGLLRSNGVWSYLTFDFATTAAVTRVDTDKFVVMTDDATPKAYILDMEVDRPGFTTDDWARPGDASDTPLSASFSLPEWWDPQGREVRVRSVIVNATKWDTGSATDNNLTCAVTALDRYGPSAALASASQSWTEAGASASTSGSAFREVFNFGDQGSGGGFQLAFTNLRGVAVRDIAVVLDVSETRAA